MTLGERLRKLNRLGLIGGATGLLRHGFYLWGVRDGGGLNEYLKEIGVTRLMAERAIRLAQRMDAERRAGRTDGEILVDICSDGSLKPFFFAQHEEMPK